MSATSMLPLWRRLATNQIAPKFDGDHVVFTAGAALPDATAYSFGRNAASQLQLNVPTAGGFLMTVNGVNFLQVATGSTGTSLTVTPAARTDVGATAEFVTDWQTTVTPGGASSTTIVGFRSLIQTSAALAVTTQELVGVLGRVIHQGTTTLARAEGLMSLVSNTSTGTISEAIGHHIAVPINSGGGAITDTIGIDIDDLTIGGTRYGILYRGTGVTNALVWGKDAAQVRFYRSADGTARLVRGSGGSFGFEFVADTSGPQIIRSFNSTGLVAQMTLQDTTISGGALSAVTISPTFSAENFQHNALRLNVTSNGTNTASPGLVGLEISLTKGTGATTLSAMTSLRFTAPTVAGTVTSSTVIGILDQSNINITTPRGIVFAATGVANSVVWGSAIQYGSAAEIIAFADSTNTRRLEITLTAAGAQSIATSAGNLNLDCAAGASVVINEAGLDNDFRIESDNMSLAFVIDAATDTFNILNGLHVVNGATINSCVLQPQYPSQNQIHRAWVISPQQNGTNTNALTGLYISMIKATGATTLGTMNAIEFANFDVTGTVTNGNCLFIPDMTDVNVTTMRGIFFNAAGVANSIVLAGSTILYGSAANDARFMDSTNARGVSFTLSAAGNQTINAIGTNAELFLQNQTITPGGAFDAVQISPTFGAEDFIHQALNIIATSNGNNSVGLNGLSISIIKGTGATTLAGAAAISVEIPSITGSLTNNFGLFVRNQGGAGITNSYAIDILSQSGSSADMRAMRIRGTGTSNAIEIGDSALILSDGADRVDIRENTGVGGLRLDMTTTSVNLRTNTTNLASLIFQNQTFTPGSAHQAVIFSSTWTAEDFAHHQIAISPVQNGANANNLSGLVITMTKATAATLLADMRGLVFASPGVAGTVTNSDAILIFDQSTAGITTPSAIRIFTTGSANAIVFGSSARMFANAAQNIRMSDSTGARGIDVTLSAAGDQTIAPSAGNLIIEAGAGATELIQLSTSSTKISTHVRILATTSSQTGNTLLVGNIDDTTAGTQQMIVSIRMNRVAVAPTGDMSFMDIQPSGTIGTAGVSTVANLSVFRINNFTYGGGLTVTRASLFRFPAAVGTHKLLPAAVDASSGNIDDGALTIHKFTENATAREVKIIAYISVDINGTLGYLPVFDTNP